VGDVTNMLKNHRQLDMIDKDEVEDHGVAVEAGAESTTHHRLGSARKPMSLFMVQMAIWSHLE